MKDVFLRVEAYINDINGAGGDTTKIGETIGKMIPALAKIGEKKSKTVSLLQDA